MDTIEPAYILYTDGGCAYNPGGPGGCAAVLLDVSSYTEKYHVTPRCAKCILRFNQEKIPKFADYKNLQVGGLDYWSYDNLKKHIEQMEHRNEFVETVSKYIDNDTDKKSCVRWYLRGLPLKHAIRKVLVDAEINKNCKK